MDGKVIFRSVKDQFVNAECYLAVFPRDMATFGTIGGVEFYFRDGRPVFFSYEEMSMNYYYYNTKPIHKRDAERLLSALTDHYDNEIEFVVAERMTAEDDALRWGWFLKK